MPQRHHVLWAWPNLLYCWINFYSSERIPIENTWFYICLIRIDKISFASLIAYVALCGFKGNPLISYQFQQCHDTRKNSLLGNVTIMPEFHNLRIESRFIERYQIWILYNHIKIRFKREDDLCWQLYELWHL